MASRAGVALDMPLAEAVAILNQTTTVLLDDAHADRIALGRIAAFCERFSPLVGWQTSGSRAGNALSDWLGESPGHLFCDVSGIAPLFGGESALASAMVTDLGRLGLTAKVAIAESLGSAWALATSDQAITIVPPGGLRAALDPLPLTRLRLPVEMLEMLRRLGLCTIEQLRRLPRADLTDRFGPALLLRLDQAFGSASEVIVPHRPLPRYEASYDLEYPTDRRGILEALLARLVEQIVAALESKCLGVLKLAGRLVCDDGPVEFEIGLFRSIAATKPLMDLIRLKMEALKLSGPVKRIEIKIAQTAPCHHHAGEMFDNPEGDDGPELAALLEKLSSRLGMNAVARPILQADALPERSFRYVPALGASRRPSPRTSRSAVSDRPLRLFSSPQRIEVEPHDGPPRSFRWQLWQQVGRLWGPERIETGWWRRGLIRRDYFRVETVAGNRYWLFRDLITKNWFLHGSFE